jgi:2'-5' RNA ligase
MAEIAALNQRLVEYGVKPSGLTKLPHVSIDGAICIENDIKITEEITKFLSTKNPLMIEFSNLGYFPSRGGINLKLGIKNAEAINAFNGDFMSAIGGKTTKLNLHLTLDRYVSREVFEVLKNSDIVYPKSFLCESVAIYKKQHKARGPYEVIEKVSFGG